MFWSTAQGRAKATMTLLIAAHLVATPLVTWWAIVYSTLGAPWATVSALWHAQATLVGIWCGISSTSLRRKLYVSLAGLLWLSMMPTARELSRRGFALPWQSYPIIFGLQPLFLCLSFAASAIAIAVASTFRPRWRIVTTAYDIPPITSQFSVRQLMVGITACAPVLLAVRLTREFAPAMPLRDLSSVVVVALIESPVAGASAVLSTWAALGQRFILLRLSVALLALPMAVLLTCYATKHPSSRIIGRVTFEETQMLVTLVTLLACRWSALRIATSRPGSPFASRDDQAGVTAERSR